jgi:DNA adenine methylase
MNMKNIVNAKPFLKWAGGKKSLLTHLEKILPNSYNSYFEPFLGGGALFFSLQPKKAFLSDLNKELINTYLQLKRHSKEVIKILEKMPYEKTVYYKIRNTYSKDKIYRAARFIYLNRSCWNGLYRENRKGEFNVPFGRFKNPTICDPVNLEAVSNALKKTSLRHVDFEIILEKAQNNDLVYLDPPYVTTHSNNGFLQYNAKIFSLEDQKRLKEVFLKLHKKKCKVILSNADHKFIRELYDQFYIYRVDRKSLLAGDKKKRKDVSELIITNYQTRVKL